MSVVLVVIVARFFHFSQYNDIVLLSYLCFNYQVHLESMADCKNHQSFGCK